MSEQLPSVEIDVPIYKSLWATCDGCECSVIIERDDERGVPDEGEWEDPFHRCPVCDGRLDFNADSDTISNAYWGKGKRATQAYAERALVSDESVEAAWAEINAHGIAANLRLTGAAETERDVVRMILSAALTRIFPSAEKDPA